MSDGIDDEVLGRLDRDQLVRLAAALDRSLAWLAAAPPAPAPPPPEPHLLRDLAGLPEESLRRLLRERLAAVTAAILAMAAAGAVEADWERLFASALRGVEELGLSYRQVIFELHSLLPFWNGGATRSGEGSTLEATVPLRTALPPLLARHQVRVLLDAPCGDWTWASRMDLGDLRYVGIDIVSDIVAANRERHGGERVTFQCADIARDPLPAASAILCRDCLIHFSVEDVRRTLANFKRSGARLLLTSTFPASPVNRPIPTGHYHPLNLEIAPHGFPPPLEMLPDVPQGKVLALWRLADLAID